MLGRGRSVVDRIRHLNNIPDDDRSRVHLKGDVPRLRRRAHLLNSATYLALGSGICTALLLSWDLGVRSSGCACGAGILSRWQSPC
jgi:hypothetical protein